MVEAMFEKSPDYFKQFQKTIFYFNCESVPDCLQLFNSYAYGFHSDNCNDFCPATNKDHYHVMLEMTNGSSKDFPFQVLPVPCVYTTFKYLISTSSKRVFQGDIFSKLQSAVLYNSKTPDKSSINSLRKRMPVNAVPCKTPAKEHKFIEKPFKSVAIQTDQLHTVTLERFQNLLNGPRCAELLMIMDIMGSGHGNLSTNSANSCVSFCLSTNN